DCIHLQSHLHEPKGLHELWDVDIIAVTRGPGLGPCLGVGVDAAKSLAVF
ncbi:7568_t:CDS:2, partial [Paraglomus brasilianum]